MSLSKLEDTDKAVPNGSCTELSAYITEQGREKGKPRSHLKMEIKNSQANQKKVGGRK